ncbi:hypothetical protein LXA43DRAFT_977562 [Ganoderma leucocontextum]|nr:hypothetical protein LXA43DRAFT_977562 [Ganoderma leucocontextum]
MSDELFIRPLLASEFLCDRAAALENGLGECCMGFTFTTTLTEDDLNMRVKDAVIHLRYACPIVAATIVDDGTEAPPSWLYPLVTDPDYAERWAEETLFILKEHTDPFQFIQAMNNKKLPYVLRDGSHQYLRIYLIRPNTLLNMFGIFFHGSHAFLDAKPTLRVFSLLLELMSSPQSVPLADIPWGTEYRNLPPGPVTATGGPREEWDTAGKALMSKISAIHMNTQASHSILDNPPDIVQYGKMQRLWIEFTEAETANIARELNVSIANRLSCTFDSAAHFVSCFVFVPVTIAWEPLSRAPVGKERLVAGMEQSRACYTEYLANPCILHLLSEQLRRRSLVLIGPSEQRRECDTVTNLGRVESILPTSWPLRPLPESNESPVFRVEKLRFGHRVTRKAPYVSYFYT